MAIGDLDAVLAIEAGAYSHPWTRGNFLDSMSSGHEALVAARGAFGIVAYSVVMAGVDEDHLLNLTVDPAHQRQGWGRRMLQEVCRRARARGAQALWLEVRASNTAALALYQHSGFTQAGRRRDYYPAPKGREDAVLMSLALGPAQQEQR